MFRKIEREIKKLMTYLVVAVWVVYGAVELVIWAAHQAWFPYVIGGAVGIAILLVVAKIYFESDTYINDQGYIVLRKHNELEHRYIAKQLLNRDLRDNEVVHHINGKKTDNDIGNLCLLNNEKHEHFHAWLRWKKEKAGRYPSITNQKRVLEKEYGGILLENAKPLPQLTNPQSEFDEDDLEIQNQLYSKLKGARIRLARKKDIPAYMVFEDRTLREMAEYVPESESEMLKIWGMEQKKFQLYGRYFLAVIRNFKIEHGLDGRNKKDPA